MCKFFKVDQIVFFFFEIFCDLFGCYESEFYYLIYYNDFKTLVISGFSQQG